MERGESERGGQPVRGATAERLLDFLGDAASADGLALHPYNMALLAYWRMIRRGRTIPAWRDVDLLDMGELLPTITLVERTKSGRFVFRFVGPRMAGWNGTDWTGEDLAKIAPTVAARLVAEDLAAIGTVERLRRLLIDYDTTAGKTVRMERLCLPLCGPEGGPLRYMLVGTQIMDGAFAQTEPRDRLDLTSARVVSRDMLAYDAPVKAAGGSAKTA